MAAQSIEVLNRAGYNVDKGILNSRKLQHSNADGSLGFIILRSADVGTYVEYGVCDAGVVGKDVLLETEPRVFEPLDLKFGVCRMVVAGLPERDIFGQSPIRVATKYPKIASDFFSRRGLAVETIKLYGAVGIAPIVGLADCIVDLVETGSTLRENNLIEYETIFSSSARLIVNRMSMKMKDEMIKELTGRLAGGTEEE